MISWVPLEAITRSQGANSGVFDVYIDKKSGVLLKKTKSDSLITPHLYKPTEQQYYRDCLHGLQNTPILGKYMLKAYDIELDGSYKSRYVQGFNLYDCAQFEKAYIKNMRLEMECLRSDIREYSSMHKLFGDWQLHNLVYERKTNKIYNVDLEGFYTYPRIYDNGNCDAANIVGIYNNFLKELENKRE
jgi:hypothetical protein